MKVKTDYTECGYITARKEYEVCSPYTQGNLGVFIIDDEGDRIFVYFRGCLFINWQDWEIIE